MSYLQSHHAEWLFGISEQPYSHSALLPQRTKAIGIVVKKGRYGGTYAHKDTNMENLNAVFIEQGMPQGERLVKLNQIAIHQMSILESGDNNDRKLLK